MAINIDNLIIDRALSGSMLDRTTGECLYSLNQITDPSLEMTGEQVYVTDAVGVRVAAFDRSKEATLTGTNAFFNLGLAAAQLGSKKIVANSTTKLTVPVREALKVAADHTIELTSTPKANTTISVNLATKDGGIVQTLSQADEAAAGKFAIDGDTITVHTDVAVGQNVIVLYKKESESAIQIDNKADAFTKGGEFWLEVLFCDICDTNTKYHGFLVFPNGKMTNETTIDFNNEATHGFTIEAMQDYCDENRKLFYIVVSE